MDLGFRFQFVSKGSTKMLKGIEQDRHSGAHLGCCGRQDEGFRERHGHGYEVYMHTAGTLC